MITREDVINALRSIHFVERTAELAEKYRRIPGEKPFKPQKDKVFGIIEGLGRSLYVKDGYYCIREREDSDKDIIRFQFDNCWTYVVYKYYDSDNLISRASIGGYQRSVTNNKNYRSGCPVAHSYDDLEDILKTVVGLYDESMEILNSGVKTIEAPIPDTKNLICISTNEKDIIEILKKINFLERFAQMSRTFCKHSKTSMPKVEKDKVFDIIRSFGYEPGYEYSNFFLKNQFVGPYCFDMRFELKYYVAIFTGAVYEEGEHLYGGLLGRVLRELAGEEAPLPNNPSFCDLDEFKKLIAVAFEMFEDFKQTLCESKGIEYTRITGEAE